MSMAESRRKYSAEFKCEAVRLSREPDRSVSEVAASLGIARSLLHRWRKDVGEHGLEAFPGNGKLKASDDELARLRKELARAQQERDILKKALAFFAKERS
jgi:transposase